MNGQMDKIAHVLQRDRRDYVTDRLGSEPWLVLDLAWDKEAEYGQYYCALIPNAKVDEVLSHPGWDLSDDSGRPAFVGIAEAGGVGHYCRFGASGDQEGIEPLVIRRSFGGIRPPFSEILEEYRLFHNLYHNSTNDEYIKIDDNGDEHTVIKTDQGAVKFRWRELRQFLAVKEMHLAIGFDIVRYSTISVSELSPEQLAADFHEGLISYTFSISPCAFKEGFSSLSLLLGKKLIPSSPQGEAAAPVSEAEVRLYEAFIVGLDKNGDSLSASCEPRDGGGATQESMSYLTPVFFGREVLAKYYANPDRFSVGDGNLKCGHLWRLRIDNSHKDHVIVWLGDLGSLSHTEQLYWKSFNVLPDGTISSVKFKRAVLAKPADPEIADLRFKWLFEKFQKKWVAKHGWPLFKTLSDEDLHLYKTLRIPLTNDQPEFDSQVLALTKILIDSLNESELKGAVGVTDSGLKGISKLEAFLTAERLPDHAGHIRFLRDLQGLRSTGVGHRKGKKWVTASAKFGVRQKDLKSVFEEILVRAGNLLEAFSDHFLS